MSLERDLALLEVLAGPEGRRRGALGVTRIAAMAGMDKGQVSRALRALESEAVVERDPETLEYRMGWRLAALAAASYPLRILRLARAGMEELSRRYPATVQSVVVPRGERIHPVYIVSATAGLQDSPWKGSGFPAWCMAAGRVLLSDMSVAELKKLYPRGLDLDEGGPNVRVRSVDDLAKRLHEVRDQGFAVSDGEFRRGVTSCAAPIRDYAGRMIAALNVAETGLDDEAAARRPELGARAREVARIAGKISADLGWTPFPVG
jgi:IclR family KDG regulon transcriptional repressor